MKVIISTDDKNYKLNLEEKDLDLLQLYCWLNRNSYYETDENEYEYKNLEKYKHVEVDKEYFTNVLLKEALDGTIGENFKWDKGGKNVVKTVINLLGKSLLERID